MSQKKNYYEILGVPCDATPEQIQHRYRQLARQHHPDVAADKAEAQRIFTQITAISEVLRDSQRRAEYDRGLATSADVKSLPRSPLESRSMGRLLSEAEGDALAASQQYEEALASYRQARGRNPNPYLEAKIARMEAATLTGSGEGTPPESQDEEKRPFWRRLFGKP